MIDRNAVKLQKQIDLKYCASCLMKGSVPPNRGTELHEIIPRSWTIKNEEARNLSFAPGLTVILCHECHQKNHQVGEMSGILLRYNILIYGREQVEHDFNALQAVMKTKLMMELPE